MNITIYSNQINNCRIIIFFSFELCHPQQCSNCRSDWRRLCFRRIICPPMMPQYSWQFINGIVNLPMRRNRQKCWNLPFKRSTFSRWHDALELLKCIVYNHFSKWAILLQCLSSSQWIVRISNKIYWLTHGFITCINDIFFSCSNEKDVFFSFHYSNLSIYSHKCIWTGNRCGLSLSACNHFTEKWF